MNVREWWIDDILNVDRPHQRTAYCFYQDTEKFRGKPIHVVEISALHAAQAENARLREALKTIANKETCEALYGHDKYNNFADGWEGVALFAKQALEGKE